ncbi:MAG: DUF4203 domain-containing protein [Candidatus Levybacteria bacterium]|nr:DUF4203 domain-containing protein [Candidatus Levybacteria bacterium]
MFEVLIFFVCAAVIGLMFLFFGYAFFRILLPIWAFFVGLMFGVHGMQNLFGANVISTSSGFIFGLFAGAILAILAYVLYSLAVYWFGLTIGYVLGSGIMMALGMDGFFGGIIGILAAMAFIVLFVKVQMPSTFIVAFTALGGAMAVIMGLFVLFGAIPAVSDSLQLTSVIVANSWFWIVIWAVLAVIGMTFQFAVLNQAQENLSKNYDWGMPAKKSKKKKR